MVYEAAFLYAWRKEIINILVEFLGYITKTYFSRSKTDQMRWCNIGLLMSNIFIIDPTWYHHPPQSIADLLADLIILLKLSSSDVNRVNLFPL